MATWLDPLILPGSIAISGVVIARMEVVCYFRQIIEAVLKSIIMQLIPNFGFGDREHVKEKDVYRRLMLSVILCLGVVGCANFAPKQGMSFTNFKHMTAKSFNGHPEMVRMVDETTVYNIPHKDKNVFYWFENDRLIRVTQGELPQQRYQIEHINR